MCFTSCFYAYWRSWQKKRDYQSFPTTKSMSRLRTRNFYDFAEIAKVCVNAMPSLFLSVAELNKNLIHKLPGSVVLKLGL